MLLKEGASLGVSTVKKKGMLEIDTVMSSLLFMLITYYRVMTDTNKHD